MPYVLNELSEEVSNLLSILFIVVPSNSQMKADKTKKVWELIALSHSLALALPLLWIKQ